MITPVERAAAVYEREPCSYTFKEDLEFHLLNGFVFSRPDFFVMGRPVVRSAPADIITGHHRFHSSDCDTWHVYLVAGNMARMWDMLPWELPFVSIERGNVLKFYRLASIRRLTGGIPITP